MERVEYLQRYLNDEGVASENSEDDEPYKLE